jgi:UDP-glucose 4-epimerase
MSTLVTGGTGFVGRYIVDDLVESGTPVVSYNRDFAAGDRPGVTCVQGELFDMPRLVRAIAEHDVDTIIHTAAQSHPEVSIDLPMTTFAANVDGTLAVFEAARMSPNPPRIVNFSSECAYGDQDEQTPVSEASTPQPNTPYGVTKVATEMLGRVYGTTYGIDIVSLRVTEIYGPGLKMPEILKDMLVAALSGESFVLEHGGLHRFHFVHASDVARAAVLAAATPKLPLHVYNISGGEQLTLAETAELIRAQVPGASITLGDGYWPGWDRQGPFDISAAAKDLGWRPRISPAAGIASYTEWLMHHDH